MCGIAGIFANGAPRPETVERMVARLVHRGPDSSGFWSKGDYSAGMRRLSIVDVAGGDQPLYDETGRIVLLYNGEIYNYPSLRRELEKEGVRFRTHSDGEVICHLYRKHGARVFEKLDGMFAVALWDDERATLLLARDFPGEKPLYYSRLPSGGVAFASEIPSLLACEDVPRELDTQALWDFPTYLWVPEPATIYRNVRAILPGEGLEISKRGMARFSFKEKIKVPDASLESDADAVAATRRIVDGAVRSRLLADVPVGAFLSSGLDSSIVCTLARQNLDALHTFCVGFENIADPYHGEADESALAESMARQLGTKHTTVRVTSRDFRDLLPTFLRAAGQPYAVSSGLGILAVAREARNQGIRVLLSGDGADEAFGGYSWYPAIPATFTPQTPPNGTTEVLRFADRDGPLPARVARMATYPPALRAWAWHYYASESEKAALFHPDVRADSSLHCFAEARFAEPLDYLRHDRNFYFHNEMLSKVDRMTMAYSVEGRAPFAAPAVQSMASRLSWQKLIRDGQLKWVLRKAFSDVLPADVVGRPKHGFNVPIDHWLNDEWRDMFVEAFADRSPLVQNGILRRDASGHAEKLLADPRKLAGHVLFTFVMLHLWMSTIEH
jgi:asparagine synthase (glutamine-hydrolysing)